MSQDFDRDAAVVCVPHVMAALIKARDEDPVLVKFHAQIVEILVKVMERRQHIGIRASNEVLSSIEASEKLCAKCLAKLSLSLHEAQMNVVFEKLTGWAKISASKTFGGAAMANNAGGAADVEDAYGSEVEEYGDIGEKRKRIESADDDTDVVLTLERAWRSLPFYRTVCALMEELRSMGSAYAWSVVPDMLKVLSLRMPFAGTARAEEAKVLKRARINSEGSISGSLTSHLAAHYGFLSAVMEAFRLTILHGSDRWDGGNANEFQKLVATIIRPLRRKATRSRSTYACI